ncbi:hypothetical protein [Flavobacterium sp.]|uniref:hypothetical protein n=1 Tax=Flavobacterium sp. TaxID=239 RepID=UPI002FD8E58D
MESIAQNIGKLYDKAEQYSRTRFELMKLNAIDKSSDVISSLAVVVTLTLILAVFTLFVNIGIALLIGYAFENFALGFFWVSGFYLLLAIIVFLFRKSLIKNPIDNIVVGKLLKQKGPLLSKETTPLSN